MKAPPTLLVQARLTSKRLPGKTLLPLTPAEPGAPQKTLLAFLLERLAVLNFPIVVALPRESPKNPKAKFAFVEKLSSKIRLFNYFQGPEEDVLGRLQAAAKTAPSKTYVRLTADNPFTSRSALLALLKSHAQHKADLSYYRGLPHGAGVEVLSARALQLAFEKAASPYQREHVTPYLHELGELGDLGKSARQAKAAGARSFTLNAPRAPAPYYAPRVCLTVDTQAQLQNVRAIVQHFAPCSTTNPTLAQLIAFAKEKPALFKMPSLERMKNLRAQPPALLPALKADDGV